MTAHSVILGGAGMLGSAVVERLSRLQATVTATAREPSQQPGPIKFLPFTVGDRKLEEIVDDLGEGDFVINCIGMIKQRMNDSSPDDRLTAIRVNAEFPYTLAQLAEKQGFRVIQIATDCVFSGAAGGYLEDSPHDAIDVYGQTKSLGEVPSSQFLNLRCSIIGPEINSNTSLLGWLLSQPQNGLINGYTDHLWNGVTTKVFAEIVAGLVESNSKLSGTFHLVPADTIDKNDLSGLVLSTFNRDDVTVVPTLTGRPVDRTLGTLHPETNEALWRLGGYSSPPRISEMVSELAAH